MPALSDQELANRAIHLLFNRVPGLEWHYFQVDLEAVKRVAHPFHLEQLKPEGGGYRWEGPE
ncbi:hypothetical protein ACFL3S_12670, partial [Gemmatimonadota bacterium]